MTPMTFSGEFRGGFHCEIRIDEGGLWTNWSPSDPDFTDRKHRKLERSYLIFRENCLREFASAHGLRLRMAVGGRCALFLGPTGVENSLQERRCPDPSTGFEEGDEREL
jgi:hypothetical protein